MAALGLLFLPQTILCSHSGRGPPGPPPPSSMTSAGRLRNPCNTLTPTPTPLSTCTGSEVDAERRG